MTNLMIAENNSRSIGLTAELIENKTKTVQVAHLPSPVPSVIATCPIRNTIEFNMHGIISLASVLACFDEDFTLLPGCFLDKIPRCLRSKNKASP
jgi:hypothetical protein